VHLQESCRGYRESGEATLGVKVTQRGAIPTPPLCGIHRWCTVWRKAVLSIRCHHGDAPKVGIPHVTNPPSAEELSDNAIKNHSAAGHCTDESDTQAMLPSVLAASNDVKNHTNAIQGVLAAARPLLVRRTRCVITPRREIAAGNYPTPSKNLLQ
jgi:hypothetical protein